MEECNLAVAVAVEAHPTGTSMHDRPIPIMSPRPVRIGDVQREHHELFTWLAYYNHAVKKDVSRSHLLAIFDSTLRCVRQHFRSIEALLDHAAWPRLHRHVEAHTRLTEDLVDYRRRLAGNEPLDPVECTHVLDALLIHFIREQPTFRKLYAHVNRAEVR
jgi:hemerythrin